MYKYQKMLPYPIDIKKKDLVMAKYIITQLGGPNGELGAALRYFSQKFNMTNPEDAATLNDIAVEELGHCEMIATMVHMLTKDASIDEMVKAGLGNTYAEHKKGIYPTDANGVPFSATVFASTGDILADLAEDMAAEQKARATYENLIDLAEDPDVVNPLLFLRQREIIYFNRFKDLFDKHNKKPL